MQSLQTFITEANTTKEWLSRELGQISTGRATPALLDGVRVEAYGSVQPLKNVASIAIEDPKTLRISPWDKSQIKDIERGIYASDLGFSVATDDQGIRVIVPVLTTERRMQLARVAKDKLEEARIAIRKARESMQNVLKDAGLSEDQLRSAKDELQKKVDEANQALEDLFKKKESEITTG